MKRGFNRTVKNERHSSPALPGKPLTIAEFKAWIAAAEKGGSISLEEAKAIWQEKKRKLLDIIHQ
jgi:hypothetical protein